MVAEQDYDQAWLLHVALLLVIWAILYGETLNAIYFVNALK